MTDEIWKEHPVYKGWFASSLGRVWVAERTIRQRNRYGRYNYNRMFAFYPKLTEISTGYLVFSGPNRVQLKAHRFILECFAGLCPEGCECAHFDGDGNNNNVDDLRWATFAENNGEDKKRQGRVGRMYGAENPLTTIPAWKLESIRNSVETGRELAVRLGISEAQVSRIRNGKSRSVS